MPFISDPTSTWRNHPTSPRPPSRCQGQNPPPNDVRAPHPQSPHQSHSPRKMTSKILRVPIYGTVYIYIYIYKYIYIYTYRQYMCHVCLCQIPCNTAWDMLCDLWNMICTIGWYIILLVPFTYKGFLAINCSTSGSLSNRRSRMPSVTKRILVFLGSPPSVGMPGTWLNPTASSFTPFSKNHPMHSLGFRLQKKKTES